MSGARKLAMWLPGPLDAAARAVIDRLAATDDVHSIAIMPDAHLADEVCVGTVVATRSTLLPAAIGRDIGCGVLARRFNGDASALQDERVAARILAGLYRAVPEVRHARAQKLPEPLAATRLGEPRLASALERDGRVQFGSLGRGNHFLELQQSDEDGRLWMAVHSGSRAFGSAVLEAYLPRTVMTDTRLHALDATSHAAEAYLIDMALALAYADLNRRAMRRPPLIYWARCSGSSQPLAARSPVSTTSFAVRRTSARTFGCTGRAPSRPMPANPGSSPDRWEHRPPRQGPRLRPVSLLQLARRRTRHDSSGGSAPRRGGRAAPAASRRVVRRAPGGRIARRGPGRVQGHWSRDVRPVGAHPDRPPGCAPC